MNDLRFAVRQLLKNPGFTAMAVLTLALGIGANTAIFSLVDGVLLKSLPVSQPGQMFFVTSGDNAAVSFPLVERIQQASKSVGETFAYQAVKIRLGSAGAKSVVIAHLVTGNFFSELGVKPVVGREILPSDDRLDAPPVAVLSHSCWEREFGHGSDVIGKSLDLNGVKFTVIGVAPKVFHSLDAQAVPDVYVPVHQRALIFPNDPKVLDEYGRWDFTMIVRLNPGVERETARAHLSALYRQVISENTRWIRTQDVPQVLARGVNLSPAGRGVMDLRDQFSRPLLILLGASGLVFLIACANVGGLLLARGTLRRREIALRMALGSNRWRAVRLLMAESCVLAGCGCSLGLLLALWSNGILVRFLPEDAVGIIRDISLNGRVLAFAIVASFIATLLVGAVPALRGTKVTLNEGLGSAGRIAVYSGAVSRLGKILVISQVAISLMLLVGAGLFVRSLRALGRVDAGFSAQNVLLLQVKPEMTGYTDSDLERLANKIAAPDLLDRLKSIPGVMSASLSSSRAFGDRPGWRMAIKLVDGAPPSEDRIGSTMRWVTPRHFETLGMPLLHGRCIEDGDSFTAPKVAVINETMARQYFGDTNPLGKRFQLTSGLEALGIIEVVGVVHDTRSVSLREPARAIFYLPFAQFPNTDNIVFEVRCSRSVSTIAAEARKEIESLDSNLTVSKVTALTDLVAASLVRERATATLSAGFGVLALLLAAIGLYGVLAYAVNQRRREMGIRLALGAQRLDVLRLVTGQGMKLVVTGAAIGLLGAITISRWLTSLLFEIQPFDPLTFASAFLLLAGAASLACWLPARRAAKADPMEALRYE